MNTKHIWLILVFMGLISCESDDDGTSEIVEPIALTSGSADFSTYVALGNSLTAGYTDGALFPASQENSMTKMLSLKFSLAGGGGFTQPLMNDNFGGLLVGGNQILENRLVFNGTAPVRLEALVGPVTPTTDLLVNNPTGPFNNMGVPGAKSFHLLFDGYGNLGNLQAGMSNPYFIRMASAPNATVLGDAMAQAPTFFTLWIGNNDILGYATTGGDGTNPITDQQTFDFAYNTLITTLTSGGAKGVVANIPNVSAIPHFTTVPHNPVPLDEATAAAVNNAYAPYNGGLQTAVAALAGTGLFSAEEAAQRTIVFQAGPNNAVVIEDETLTDLGAINPAFAGLPKYRQATENDLLVLPASSFIGTLADPNNPLTVNGVAIPLADKWVLLPSEQQDIATATASFNATIAAAATAAGLAQVDANSLLDELAGGGIQSGNFTLTSSLVTGGAFSLDGIHPTSRGYALIANEFLKAIDATYGSNFEASGNLNDVGTFPTNYSVMLP